MQSWTGALASISLALLTGSAGLSAHAINNESGANAAQVTAAPLSVPASIFPGSMFPAANVPPSIFPTPASGLFALPSSKSVLKSAAASGTVSNSSSNSGEQDNGGPTLKGNVSAAVHQKGDAAPLHIKFQTGALLLSRSYDVIVDSLVAPISVDANSVVLIVATEKSLTVYDLHDDHKHAVVINHKSGSIALIPGHSGVIADSSFGSFDYVNPAPFVYYRHLVNAKLDAETQSYQADFDIRSLVSGMPAIKNMIGSDDANVRKLMDRMLKTTAIMMQLTQNSDPFALYMPPNVRALAIKSAK